MKIEAIERAVIADDSSRFTTVHQFSVRPKRAIRKIRVQVSTTDGKAQIGVFEPISVFNVLIPEDQKVLEQLALQDHREPLCPDGRVLCTNFLECGHSVFPSVAEQNRGYCMRCFNRINRSKNAD